VFFARHGRTYAGESFLRGSAGRTGVELMRESFGPLSDADAWALVHEKETIYRDLFRPVFSEIAGFRGFARRAKAAGIRIACATAGDADNLAFAIKGLDMAGDFDALVGAQDVANGKPAPDLFLLAAKRMGVAPADCIVFEDAPLGIEAARRARMSAIAVTSGEPAAKLAAPVHVLTAIADYIDLDPLRVLAMARRAAPHPTENLA
jgi:beta-phosphoglucomutase-like phosphatase (HAD superfamily)